MEKAELFIDPINIKKNMGPKLSAAKESGLRRVGSPLAFKVNYAFNYSVV